MYSVWFLSRVSARNSSVIAQPGTTAARWRLTSLSNCGR
jgi:hypothetical protein